MYTDVNFPTKKAFKEAVEKAVKGEGPAVTYHQPGGFFPTDSSDGVKTFEGPHYPQPHKWYAQGVSKDGKIVKVK